MTDTTEQRIERVARAIQSAPSLFLRANKSRKGGLIYEVGRHDIEPVVIASFRDYEAACARLQELQTEAFARAADAISYRAGFEAAIEVLQNPEGELFRAALKLGAVNTLYDIADYLAAHRPTEEGK